MRTERLNAHPGIFRDVDTGEYGFILDLPTLDGRRRQQRSRGYRTIRDAETARDELRRNARRGEVIKPSKSTLAGFLIGTWLPTLTKRPTTVDGYRRAVRNHIVPTLGTVPLQQLTRATVAVWIAELSDKGLSAKTIRNVVFVLSSALTAAVELGLVPVNVTHRMKNLPAKTTPEPQAWTIAEAQRFIAHVRDDRWYPLWRFLAVTGCRRGEALGLRWDDVDLDAGTVTIRRQRTIAGGSVVEGPPKTTTGARTIALDSAMVATLRRWRTQRVEEGLAMGVGFQGGYVFCWQTGEPLWPQKVTAWFRQHCEDVGLTPIGVHGLRHTAATWMIARRENPKLVQQRLGHSDVATTLRLYSHVQPGHDLAAAEALGAALDAT